MKRNMVCIIVVLITSMILAGCTGSEKEPSSNLQEIEESLAETVEEENKEEPKEEPKEEIKEEIKEETEDASEESGEAMSEEEIKKAVSEILKEIDSYKWDLFMDGIIYDLKDVGSDYAVELTPKERTRIAAESYLVKRGEEIDIEPGWITALTLDTDDVEKACLRLFGEPADILALDTYSDGVEGPSWLNGELVDASYIGETDTDLALNGTYYYIDPGDIAAAEEIFIGHWGYIHDISNFLITYDFAEKAGSEYGVVLTGISIERIGNETLDADDRSESEYIDYDGFYGIWVGASKSEDEANKILGTIKDKGLSDGHVFLSSDWANLNPEPYYTVTVGMYETEDQAKAGLNEVKSAGFGNAYVKYSGEYLGY